MQGFKNRTRTALVATAVMMLGLGAGSAQAYPSYNDGSGNGCVSCHTGFDGAPASPLHQQHLINLGIVATATIDDRCNVCHTNGQGSIPVYTMGSNLAEGGGYGCVGCHGQDYGETAWTLPSSPYSGKPKASGYGLRLVHANAGVTVCANCHAANPHPVLDETVRPPYYPMKVSDLRNSCDSTQEDLSFDVDMVGLDNDGNGFADYPADPNCPLPTTTTSTTTTTTTTLPVTCGLSPAVGCTEGAKAKFILSEKAPGKEKVKFLLSKLVPAVVRADFGAPVTSDTSYALCLYNGSNTLIGSWEVARGSELCGIEPCWENFKDEGYAYADKDMQTADGVTKIQLAGGEAGKGKVLLQANNKASTMPTGFAAMMNGATSATVQLVNGDGDCFGMALPTVKKADGLSFSAAAP